MSYNVVTDDKPRAIFVRASWEGGVCAIEMGMGAERHPSVKRRVHELAGNW